MNRLKKRKSFKTEQHLTAILVSVLSTVALIALGGYKKFKNFIKHTNPLRVFDSFKSDMDETMKMPEDAFKERELVKLFGYLNSRKVFLSFFWRFCVWLFVIFLALDVFSRVYGLSSNLFTKRVLLLAWRSMRLFRRQSAVLRWNT